MFRFESGEAPWVHYLCACGQASPIEELYLCFQCHAVRCRLCTAEEIESYYCRACLENMPTTEAMTFRNRCMRCYMCPICQTTLQIIIGLVRGQKQYHLCCQHCSWDSSMVAMSGGSVDEMYSSTTYYLKEDPRQSLFLGIVEKYKKNILQLQKQQRKSLYPIEHRSLERLSISHLERRPGDPSPFSQPKHNPSKPSPSLSDLLDDSTPYDELTTIEQRFANLPEQTRLVADLRGLPMPLLTKRSRRCRFCKKYVVKTEGMPTSSSPFKMENLAVHFLPRVLIREWTPNYIFLLISNPSTSTISTFRVVYDGNAVNSGLEQEISIDANDPLAESQSEMDTSNPAIIERERNTLVLRINHTGETEFPFRMIWKFTRGAEEKELLLEVRVRYR